MSDGHAVAELAKVIADGTLRAALGVGEDAVLVAEDPVRDRVAAVDRADEDAEGGVEAGVAVAAALDGGAGDLEVLEVGALRADVEDVRHGVLRRDCGRGGADGLEGLLLHRVALGRGAGAVGGLELVDAVARAGLVSAADSLEAVLPLRGVERLAVQRRAVGGEVGRRGGLVVLNLHEGGVRV